MQNRAASPQSSIHDERVRRAAQAAAEEAIAKQPLAKRVLCLLAAFALAFSMVPFVPASVAIADDEGVALEQPTSGDEGTTLEQPEGGAQGAGVAEGEGAGEGTQPGDEGEVNNDAIRDVPDALDNPTPAPVATQTLAAAPPTRNLLGAEPPATRSSGGQYAIYTYVTGQGSVTTSVDGTVTDRADETDAVILTITPEAGWEFSTLDLRVTNSDGEEQRIFPQPDGTVLFWMPASSAYVYVTFTQSSDPASDSFFGVLISDDLGNVNTGGSYQLDYPGLEGDAIRPSASNNFVADGSTVTITALPDAGYKFIGWYQGEPNVQPGEGIYVGEPLSTNAVYEFVAPLNMSVPYLCAVFGEDGPGRQPDQVQMWVGNIDGQEAMSQSGGKVAVAYTPSEPNTYDLATKDGTSFVYGEVLQFYRGDECTVYAQADLGYQFVGWYHVDAEWPMHDNKSYLGDPISTEPTFTYKPAETIVAGDTSPLRYVCAVFEAAPQQVFIYYSPGEGAGGTAFADSVIAGSDVNVRAFDSFSTFAAPSGKHFAGWTGSDGATITADQVATGYNKTIPQMGTGVTGSYTFTAYYEPDTVYLCMGVSEGGTYSVATSNPFPHEDMDYPMNMALDSGDSVTLTATPAEGYEFKGFYTGIRQMDSTQPGYGSVTDYDPNSLVSATSPYTFTINENTNIYALFAKPTHTVTFGTDGGTVIEDQQVPDGEKAMKPADPQPNPEMEGLHFDKWTVVPPSEMTYDGYWYTVGTTGILGGPGAIYDFNAPVTGDVDLYACYWGVLTLATYDKTNGVERQGGTITYASPYDRTVSNPISGIQTTGIAGTTFNLVATPADGYTFVGWATTPTGGIITNSNPYSLVFSQKTTLYALFESEAPSYDLSFQFLVQSPPPAPALSAVLDSLTVNGEDWTPASGVSVTKAIPAGAQVTAKVKMTDSGMIGSFNNDDTITDFTPTVADDRSEATFTFTMPEAHAAVRVVVTDSVTLNYDANGGAKTDVWLDSIRIPKYQASSSAQISVNEALNDPYTFNTMVRPAEGYEFDGIEVTQNATGTTVIGKPGETVTANLSQGGTIKFLWVKDVTVTFDAKGGSPEPAEQHLRAGEKAVEPAEPTKTGWEPDSDSWGGGFDGWYTNEDYSGDRFDFNTPVEDDITLYARWNGRLDATAYDATNDATLAGGTIACENVEESVTGLTQYGSSNIAEGSKVTLTATPDTGYRFVRWEQPAPDAPVTVSTDATYQFTFTDNPTVLYAVFEVIPLVLTLHWSSIDGVDLMPAIKIEVPKGTTVAQALEQYQSGTTLSTELFQKDGYKDWGYRTPEPITEYSSYEDLWAVDVEPDTAINDNMDLYYSMIKEITEVEITVVPPTAGTSTEIPADSNPWKDQTNPPQVSTNGQNYSLNDGDGWLPAIWIDLENEGFYQGDFEAGNEYDAIADVVAKFGYMFAEGIDETFAGECTVNGGELVETLWDADWLSIIYKVTIPVPATITYDLAGGTLDGQTGTVTVETYVGAKITLPTPTREGYEFDYWEGSKYNAGDTYTVPEGGHTFTAVWKLPASGGSSDSTPAGGIAQTGDGTPLAAGAAIALLGALALAIARRRFE